MPQLFLLAAAANVWVLALILAGGFAVQLIAGELPCPLCVMQRIALMLCALGPLHILLSARDSALTCRTAAVGNGMAIIAALLGAAASARQALLHILPGDPGFGAPVMELHLYTWGLIAFACQIAASAVLLIATGWLKEKPLLWGGLARWTTIAFAAIVFANLLSVIAEAGFHWGLPESPENYLMFR
jgi:disulfide bond formation protein DsbB